MVIVLIHLTLHISKTAYFTQRGGCWELISTGTPSQPLEMKMALTCVVKGKGHSTDLLKSACLAKCCRRMLILI